MDEHQAPASDDPSRQVPCSGRAEDPLTRAVATGVSQAARLSEAPLRVAAPQEARSWDSWQDYHHDIALLQQDPISPRQRRIAALFENEAAWNAYQQLPGPFKDIIWLFDIELAEFAEAAAELSLPDSTLMTLYRRAKNTLRIIYARERESTPPPE
ncbi:hypothetical protein C6401_11350 [Arthrobacter woluwensis]|uniref:hypothetical protein n=1 Tax=Arthrobacter woluwensis TaxID=156980 RepID=UPI000D13A124|nr:hypothetical protein [Arthrobacter woluwensis]PSS43707.1 hypothetical protein C6401_11350 [Arthrobacter woluwensis]